MMVQAGAPSGRSVDAVDRRLIDLLSVNSRSSVSELASGRNLPRERLSAVRQAPGGRRDPGFTVRVDPRRLGLDVTALIIVNGEQRSWRELLASCSSCPVWSMWRSRRAVSISC